MGGVQTMTELVCRLGQYKSPCMIRLWFRTSLWFIWQIFISVSGSEALPLASPPPFPFTGVHRVDGRFILPTSAPSSFYLSLELFPNKLIILLTPTQHLIWRTIWNTTDIKKNLKICNHTRTWQILKFKFRCLFHFELITMYHLALFSQSFA